MCDMARVAVDVVNEIAFRAEDPTKRNSDDLFRSDDDCVDDIDDDSEVDLI